MSVRKFIIAITLAATSLIPVIASAGTRAKDRCVLVGHRVNSVKRYEVVEWRGRSASYRLAGAQVYVQAEPGLTAQWLQLTIERHLAQMRSRHMGDCVLELNGLQVQVDSAGSGFAVRIVAKDPGQAKEVLRRAELLQG
ncbi:MAG TPA: hypothetical protein VG937_00295 [Polyangiaceae bacterium]|nr:hypothetical protein [Polyangiaceae bacterium]